jgi:hypothetical protein
MMILAAVFGVAGCKSEYYLSNLTEVQRMLGEKALTAVDEYLAGDIEYAEAEETLYKVTSLIAQQEVNQDVESLLAYLDSLRTKVMDYDFDRIIIENDMALPGEYYVTIDAVRKAYDDVKVRIG